MANLTQLRERVKILLHDSAGIAWSEAEIDEALRLAVDEYGRLCPEVREAVLQAAAPGREIPLAELAGLRSVTAAFWPYTGAPGEENLAAGYRLDWDGETPTLVLSAFKGRLPHPGDQVRIWYTRRPTLAGLDGAETTSLPKEDESLVVLGACGYACTGAAVDRSEVLDPGHLASLGAKLLASFRQSLAGLARTANRLSAEPWGAGWSQGGWKLDGWDG